MFNPCYESCYLRYGKQYTEECDATCSYAKVWREKQELERILKAVVDYHSDWECHYCKQSSICASGHCENREFYELDLEKIKESYRIVD